MSGGSLFGGGGEEARQARATAGRAATLRTVIGGLAPRDGQHRRLIVVAKAARAIGNRPAGRVVETGAGKAGRSDEKVEGTRCSRVGRRPPGRAVAEGRNNRRRPLRERETRGAPAHCAVTSDFFFPCLLLSPSLSLLRPFCSVPRFASSAMRQCPCRWRSGSPPRAVLSTASPARLPTPKVCPHRSRQARSASRVLSLAHVP